jgi:hypothetical protein
MDSQFFRVASQPNYYHGLSSYEAERVANKTTVSKRNTEPSRDARFPGWAAPMADGRLVTDYRPHCDQNIPAGKQFATKEWIVSHTDDIIEVSRMRQAKITGAIYGDDPTVVPPPESLVKCDKTTCEIIPSSSPNGIGTERVYDKAPDLFGTFSYMRARAPGAPHVGLNKKFEGGRNSWRGREFQDMGNKPLGETTKLY